MSSPHPASAAAPHFYVGAPGGTRNAHEHCQRCGCAFEDPVHIAPVDLDRRDAVSDATSEHAARVLAARAKAAKPTTTPDLPA